MSETDDPACLVLPALNCVRFDLFTEFCQKNFLPETSTSTSTTVRRTKGQKVINYLRGVSVEKVSTTFKSWVKRRKFRLVQFPSSGINDVLCTPLTTRCTGTQTKQVRTPWRKEMRTVCRNDALLDGPLEWRRVAFVEDFYSILLKTHTHVLNHGGYKTLLSEVRKDYSCIPRSAVQKFVNLCSICSRHTKERTGDSIKPVIVIKDLGSEAIRHNVVTTLNDSGVILQMVKSVIPPLQYNKHKGQDGRIATIGGCKEYTGAPYFAAMAALKTGCDLSHVFCAKEAAPVIKSYSPELIVHPVLDSNNAVEETSTWLPRMHTLVIGPGLGRDQSLLTNVLGIIERAKELNIPMVIDADAVFLLGENSSAIENYTNAILTPNAVEFDRLYRKVIGEDPEPAEPVGNTMRLSQKLGHVTVVMKGENDVISNGVNVLVCCGDGSARRCGGQGDILAGATGTFSYWAHKAHTDTSKMQNEFLMHFMPPVCAAYAGCLLTKRCSALAFSKYRRSTTTTDLMKEIGYAFTQLFDD